MKNRNIKQKHSQNYILSEVDKLKNALRIKVKIRLKLDYKFYNNYPEDNYEGIDSWNLFSDHECTMDLFTKGYS